MLAVDGAQAREIERKLIASAFSFHSAPHATFSAKGQGVVATHYHSGKLVIQGEHPESFVTAYVDGASINATKKKSSAPQAIRAPDSAEETMIGGDESGKGDYFGPLVVAAVRLEPALARALARGEVRDCKLMSDEQVLRVGAALRANVPFAVARLDPDDYNAEHARVKNLNPMLAALHAKAVRELATPGVRVVIDQFANERLMQTALKGVDIKLEQRHRAEELLAVAAASVIAREQFLSALKELSETWAVDLAKGAGDPVQRAARRFLQLHGMEKLGHVAKLHFKNTQKLGGAAR